MDGRFRLVDEDSDWAARIHGFFHKFFLALLGMPSGLTFLANKLNDRHKIQILILVFCEG